MTQEVIQGLVGLEETQRNSLRLRAADPDNTNSTSPGRCCYSGNSIRIVHGRNLWYDSEYIFYLLFFRWQDDDLSKFSLTTTFCGYAFIILECHMNNPAIMCIQMADCHGLACLFDFLTDLVCKGDKGFLSSLPIRFRIYDNHLTIMGRMVDGLIYEVLKSIEILASLTDDKTTTVPLDIKYNLIIRFHCFDRAGKIHSGEQTFKKYTSFLGCAVQSGL
jgi:hypothetical protein